MEAMMLRLMGTGSSGVDLVVVITLALVSVLYFLAPVLGYQAEKRGMLLISMYLLVGFGVVVLLEQGIQYLMYLGSSNEGTGKGIIHLGFLFGMLKLVVFLAAEGTFVFGLSGLKRGA